MQRRQDVRPSYTTPLLYREKKTRKERYSYIDQVYIKEKVAVAMYKEVKETALDRKNWIKLHRQELRSK